MHRSKATVTKEENEEILRLHKQASTTPVMMVGGFCGATQAWKSFHAYIDGLAKAYGLKDQPGEWGFDSETGQFLSEFPIKEEPTDASL